MTTPFLDALSAIIEAGKLSSAVTNQTDREQLKSCIDHVFKSLMTENTDTVIPDTEPVSLTLTEQQYTILAEMVKKGKKYTNVSMLAKLVYGNNSNIPYDSVLPALRRFLRNNSSPIDPCEIEIAQKRSRKKGSDQYRIKIGSMERVKDILSDPCYSEFPSYTDYKLQPASAPTNVKKFRTHAELELAIIAAIPLARNINHVCEMVDRASSGSMYRLVNSLMIKYDLQIGSKYNINQPMANDCQPV